MNTIDAIKANTASTLSLRQCLRVATSTFFTGIFGLLSTWMLLTDPQTAAHVSATQVAAGRHEGCSQSGSEQPINRPINRPIQRCAAR